MMEKEHSSKFNSQRGSATVEAVIGFTVFLFTIFTILGMANLCRAQMLVSAAVDTAAKEMSQYAYFYEMSGLQKFEEKLDDNAQIGKDNINDIIGTVDQLYSSINGAVDQTVQEKTNTENALQSGEMNWDALSTSISNMKDSAENVSYGIQTVSNEIGDVCNDPMLYMRSIVALIGSEGMEVAKRAIAVPLAKSFVAKHFGDDTEEANENLKALGIEDGLDGMNFNLSKVFSDDEHQDIQITVIYKVKLFQVFDWVVLEANVSKVACCRAWLGGDDVIVKASGTSNADLGSAETEPAGTESTDSTDPTDPSEATEPTEETTTSNTSTGNWALQHDPSGYYGSDRNVAFSEEFYSTYTVDTYEGNFSYATSTSPTMAYTYSVHATWTPTGGTDPGVDLLEDNIKLSINTISANETENQNGVPQEFKGITKVVYVPENIPEDQYSTLLQDAEQTEAKMESYAASKGLSEDFEVKIVVIKGGGTYDYNSSPSDYVNIGGEE